MDLWRTAIMPMSCHLVSSYARASASTIDSPSRGPLISSPIGNAPRAQGVNGRSGVENSRAVHRLDTSNV